MEIVTHSCYQRLRISQFDPDRLRAVIAGGDFEHRILAASSCSIDVRNWRHGPVQMDRGEYSFGAIVQGQFPRGHLCIGAVSRMEKGTRINGHDVSEANLQIYAEDAELLFSAGPNILWKAFCVKRDFLQSAALAHLGRPLKLPDSGFLNLVPDPFLLARLERLTERCFQELHRRPELAPKWRAHLTTAYIEALATADSLHADSVHRRAKRRSEVLGRADSFLRAQIGQNYSSRALCHHLGMTERAVQLYFKEEVGMSPKRWFRQLAMHRAFEILKGGEGGGGAVTAAAVACGFDHLGRFSQSYRQIFDELPSETARNCR